MAECRHVETNRVQRGGRRKSGFNYASKLEGGKGGGSALGTEARELETQSGGVAMPRDVADMRAALEQGGIKHVVIAEMVEVTRNSAVFVVPMLVLGSPLAPTMAVSPVGPQPPPLMASNRPPKYPTGPLFSPVASGLEAPYCCSPKTGLSAPYSSDTS